MKKRFATKRAKVALVMSFVMLISGISGLFVALTQLGFLGAKGSIDFVTNNVNATVSEATISGGKFSSGETLPELVFNAEEKEDDTVVSEDSDITEGETVLPNSDQNTNSLTNEQKESSGIVSWENIDIEFDEGSTEASIAFAITNTGTEQLAVALQNVSGTFTNVTYEIKINGKEVDNTVINPEGIVTHNITAEIVITFTVTVPNGNALVRNFSIPIEFKTTSVRTEVSDLTEPIFPDIPEDPETGFTYEFTADGTGIYFGEWPQTIAAAGVTFESTPDEDGYYLGSDGERYAKYTTQYSEILGDEAGIFTEWGMGAVSDGTVLQDATTYYFKVEKLLWDIVYKDSATNIATIVCRSILQAQAFQANYVQDETNSSIYYATDAEGNILTDGSGNKIYANNYEYSQLRQFLIEDFYNRAFNDLQAELIQQITVDNSAATTNSSTNPYACNNTNDKVWVLSYAEAMELANLDEYLLIDSLKPTTDYAKATCAITYTKSYFQAIIPGYTSDQIDALVLDEGFGITVTANEDGSYTFTEEQQALLEAFYASGFWWLRSPDSTYSYRALVVGLGTVGNDGVSDPGFGVVPALQIQLQP